MNRVDLASRRRWVIKIGSSLLTDNGQAVAASAVARWVAQIAALRARGVEVVVVSSGAVAAGMLRLGLGQRPDNLSQLQAAAAVGQLDIASLWDRALAAQQINAAQVLLTHEDAADRQRYLNARNTLRALLDWGVVPVINENDTVASDEIRFGDNDTLAAVAVDLCSADLLVILTDQQGIYSSDPRFDPQAELIGDASIDDERLVAAAGGSGGTLGRGGMKTKLQAAQIAARSGVSTVIAGGSLDEVLVAVADGQSVGTCLWAGEDGRMTARKRWIAAQRRAVGKLWLDDGAREALLDKGRSLLPVGVTSVEGRFAPGDLVHCVDASGQVIARGLSNYDSEDARRLCGVTSTQINQVLGRPGEPELVHRNNLILGA